MKKLVLLALVPFMTVRAQAPSNPLTKATQRIDDSIRTNVLKAAEEMPEENYSFKPVDTVRSFGQLVGHVADAQYEFCSPVIGDGAKSPGVENKTTKADLLEALKTAYAYCDKAYDGMTDAKGAEMAHFLGRSIPKLTLLSLNTAHTDEH
ncbi:MAG: DinB family protein, partial [Acidobacteriaceae bacterium]|nr:DinB family protein [Acidobacteriaceae bacterium]